MRVLLCLLFVFLKLTQGVLAQEPKVKISGKVLDQVSLKPISFASVILNDKIGNRFITGTISDEEGLFILTEIIPGDYYLEIRLIGYEVQNKAVFIGSNSPYLNIGEVLIKEALQNLQTVEVIGIQEGLNQKMDKKTYNLATNISQSGGSVLQAMQNLPGVSVQDGKIQIRGNDRIAILIDGKQTALTGFGNQSGLDNLPSSSVERIEIINNPSAKYDANGNGGIINIILNKEEKEGFNGKVGLALGQGALWEKKANLPGIRPQYSRTPKINPSVNLNYRSKNINFFLSADNLYTETLNKNEFVTREYENGSIIHQQLKRNRNTNFFTSNLGLDWQINPSNTFTISGLFGSEKIIDRGDQPFFTENYLERLRLWQFLEDEIKTTVMGSLAFTHQYADPGHTLSTALNYTFHREDEQYFFTNTLPSSIGKDAFKLLSDENVVDATFDFVMPQRNGRYEAGFKIRRRWIPTNMQFFPGINSPIDSLAGGAATYKETIPAVYGNYTFETKKIAAELGIRLEYVQLKYNVNPNHPTYTSDGYSYFQPFPNSRIAYKINGNNKITGSYNRRVDRPNEVDIRIFPKYDDAEIIKVGNPALEPQFTNAFELGWKTVWNSGSLYFAGYHRRVNGTITRISTTYGPSNLIYAIFQNAGKSYHSGMEIIYDQDINNWYSFDVNLLGYKNQIDAFSVENLYPYPHTFAAVKQEILSGNFKLNSKFKISESTTGLLTIIYLAPDIIPQGKIKSRFSLDMGIKKTIQKGKGELYVNATDIMNTMIVHKTINGSNFSYISADYYETQVVRTGYNYKF